MNYQNALARYDNLRYNIFSWRYNSNVIYKVLLVIGMACITGALAQFRFYLPWSPVPITGQTFSVLMSGVLLGTYWGGISQLAYVIIGIAGMPWFAGGKSGVSALLGPTGGYLLGFIIASLILGYIVDKYVKSRNFLPMLGLMLAINFLVIYGFGLLNLSIWLKAVKGSSAPFLALLNLGMTPFIIGDILKIALAAGITKAITPKKSYN